VIVYSIPENVGSYKKLNFSSVNM